MVSYDRHASHDSPYRTGKHLPLSQSRHEPLTSVATSAADSRADLTNPYDDENEQPALNGGYPGSPTGIGSPNRAYSPGMRSFSSQKRPSGEGEIQMQSFHDGAPPPPPVSHSWTKIDQWLENNYEELYDNTCSGCTQNDINELEHDLDCSLPLEVRDSLMVHDGQERGGLPTGVVFGSMLLDCEEIVEEHRNWRVVNEQILNRPPRIRHTPSKAEADIGISSSAAAAAEAASQENRASMWREELSERQDSQPPGAVQRVYSHASWIPLVRDWGGNYLAIDLAPGPAGKWGQVILFGRDYDCKYVVARSWGVFLAILADDYCSGKVQVDEETNELRLNAFRNATPPYFETLRWRADQKFGRRYPRRKGMPPLNTNSRPNKDSPYGSPTPSEDRGRSSENRFTSPVAGRSPKTMGGVSRPLARVAEEGSSSDVGTPLKNGTNQNIKESAEEDLIETSTPVKGNDEEEPNKTKSSTLDSEVSGEMKNVMI